MDSSSVDLTIQMGRMLRALEEANGCVCWLDDEFPKYFTPELINEARKRGFISYSDGDFLQPTQQVALKSAGLRALGHDVPLTNREKFFLSLRRFIGSKSQTVIR